MNIIAALDLNGGIGKDGKLLCRLPSDLKYFKAQTVGKTVIMGYNTLMSLPRSSPLPDRRNIILTAHRKAQITASFPEIVTSGSISELSELLTPEERASAFVIGGASVYAQLLPFCDRLFLTHILAEFSSDVFFPKIDFAEWRLCSKTDIKTENNISFYHAIYERLGAK